MALAALPDLFSSAYRLRPDPGPLQIDRGRRWAREQGWEQTIPGDLAHRIGTDLEWHGDAVAAGYANPHPGRELRALLVERLGPARRQAEAPEAEPVEEEPVAVTAVRRVREYVRGGKSARLEAREDASIVDEVKRFADVRGIDPSEQVRRYVRKGLELDHSLARQSRVEHPRPERKDA